MADERHMIICGRVDDPHRRDLPGSEPFPCGKCAATVMVSRATRERAEFSLSSTVIYCVECAATGDDPPLDGALISPATEAQRAELESAGHSGFAMQDHWGHKVMRKGSGG